MVTPQTVVVFGFGSAFNDPRSANDVDLLIVHRDASFASCNLAIQCKHFLEGRIGRVHVTMLSSMEERQFQFKVTSCATFLGKVSANSLETDLACLLDHDVLSNWIEDTPLER